MKRTKKLLALLMSGVLAVAIAYRLRQLPR